MPVVYHCPHCRQPVTVPDEMLGQAIGCPHCRNPFQTFPPAPAPLPLPPPVPPPAAQQPFSLDDDEPHEEEGFDELDEEPRRKRRGDRDRDRGGARYGRGQQKKKPHTLANLFGAIGGIVGGVGVTVFNASNRRPGQGFDPKEILIAAVVGGVCGGLGFLFGMLLEGSQGGQKPRPRQRRRRDDDDD